MLEGPTRSRRRSGQVPIQLSDEGVTIAGAVSRVRHAQPGPADELLTDDPSCVARSRSRL